MKSLFSKSLSFAAKKHYYQERLNGDAFIEHPIQVCKLLRELKLNLPEEAYAAALLHDVCEDSDTTYKEIAQEFGLDIARRVYFLSKEPKENFKNSEERLKNYISKLRDGAKLYPDILLIKMCDQLDNLSSLHVFPKEKQEEQRREIREFYLPLYEECDGGINSR